jgi:hypothetical protein
MSGGGAGGTAHPEALVSESCQGWRPWAVEVSTPHHSTACVEDIVLQVGAELPRSDLGGLPVADNAILPNRLYSEERKLFGLLTILPPGARGWLLIR